MTSLLKRWMVNIIKATQDGFVSGHNDTFIRGENQKRRPPSCRLHAGRGTRDAGRGHNAGFMRDCASATRYCPRPAQSRYRLGQCLIKDCQVQVCFLNKCHSGTKWILSVIRKDLLLHVFINIRQATRKTTCWYKEFS